VRVENLTLANRMERWPRVPVMRVRRFEIGALFAAYVRRVLDADLTEAEQDAAAGAAYTCAAALIRFNALAWARAD
jgi:hypothetical protein